MNASSALHPAPAGLIWQRLIALAAINGLNGATRLNVYADAVSSEEWGFISDLAATMGVGLEAPLSKLVAAVRVFNDHLR